MSNIPEVITGNSSNLPPQQLSLILNFLATVNEFEFRSYISDSIKEIRNLTCYAHNIRRQLVKYVEDIPIHAPINRELGESVQNFRFSFYVFQTFFIGVFLYKVVSQTDAPKVTDAKAVTDAIRVVANYFTENVVEKTQLESYVSFVEIMLRIIIEGVDYTTKNSNDSTKFV